MLLLVHKAAPSSSCDIQVLIKVRVIKDSGGKKIHQVSQAWRTVALQAYEIAPPLKNTENAADFYVEAKNSFIPLQKRMSKGVLFIHLLLNFQIGCLQDKITSLHLSFKLTFFFSTKRKSD